MLNYDDIPADHEVQPLRTQEERDGAKSLATCGACGLSWDDGISTGMTPAPSARCPFEYFHIYEDDDDFEPHDEPPRRHASPQAWRRLRERMSDSELLDIAEDIAGIARDRADLTSGIVEALINVNWDERKQI